MMLLISPMYLSIHRDPLQTIWILFLWHTILDLETNVHCSVLQSLADVPNLVSWGRIATETDMDWPRINWSCQRIDALVRSAVPSRYKEVCIHWAQQKNAPSMVNNFPCPESLSWLAWWWLMRSGLGEIQASPVGRVFRSLSGVDLWDWQQISQACCWSIQGSDLGIGSLVKSDLGLRWYSKVIERRPKWDFVVLNRSWCWIWIGPKVMVGGHWRETQARLRSDMLGGEWLGGQSQLSCKRVDHWVGCQVCLRNFLWSRGSVIHRGTISSVSSSGSMWAFHDNTINSLNPIQVHSIFNALHGCQMSWIQPYRNLWSER